MQTSSPISNHRWASLCMLLSYSWTHSLCLRRGNNREFCGQHEHWKWLCILLSPAVGDKKDQDWTRRERGLFNWSCFLFHASSWPKNQAEVSHSCVAARRWKWWNTTKCQSVNSPSSTTVTLLEQGKLTFCLSWPRGAAHSGRSQSMQMAVWILSWLYLWYAGFSSPHCRRKLERCSLYSAASLSSSSTVPEVLADSLVQKNKW